MLYDFEGDIENGELTISEGDTITVINQASVICYICDLKFAHGSFVGPQVLQITRHYSQHNCGNVAILLPKRSISHWHAHD